MVSARVSPARPRPRVCVLLKDATAAVPGALASLTLEQVLGTQDSEVFEGGILPGFEFRCTAGEVAKLSLPGIICETSQGLASQGTPVQPTSSYIKHDHAGAFGFNSLSWNVNDIMIKADRKYSDRMQLGSQLTKEPTPSDFMEITARITVEYGQTAGLNAAWLADTQGDATLTFTGPGNNSLVIVMQNAIITDIGRPVSGPGVITQTVDFVCESDGTDEGLLMTMNNDNTNYSDNG